MLCPICPSSTTGTRATGTAVPLAVALPVPASSCQWRKPTNRHHDDAIHNNTHPLPSTLPFSLTFPQQPTNQY